MTLSPQRPARFLAAGLVSLAVAAGTAPVAAQVVTGIVLDDDTGDPLAAAVVSLVDSAGAVLRTVDTDDAGRFRLAIEAPGAYTVQAERLGWTPGLSQLFRVAGDPVLEIEFRLSAAAIRLPPVTVRTRTRSARLAEAGFFERQELGIGRFITAEEIAARAGFSLSDLLRLEPSIEHLWDPENARFLVIFRGAARMSFESSPCFPLLVLDGTRTDSHAVDDIVQPEDVAGMELYPSGNGAPVRFTGLGAPCGVIMIWTKRS